jgi:hypothetical protein
MVFSTLQFMLTTLLVAVCALLISFSQGDIPVLALLIPALWVLPKFGLAGVVLAVAMFCFSLTLPYQPVALSVGLWVLFPLLMVSFSKNSTFGILMASGFIVCTLLAGLMLAQAGGKLIGEPMMTIVQAISIGIIWWCTSHWKTSTQHRWWVLLLLIPLWLMGSVNGAIVALCMVGLVAILESLSQSKTFSWDSLLCWTLPTIGFAALVVSPDVEVPRPIFVVWICLLCTAWMTDYIIQCVEENQDV